MTHYPWTCKFAGCDATRAVDSKYCDQHGREMAARISKAATHHPARDTGTIDLFAPPAERLPPTPAARGQETSARAAASNQQKARGQAITLLRLVKAKDAAGLTCDELEQVTGWSHQTVSARLYQMEQRGWLERPGHTRATRTGSQAKAYILTERGQDQLRQVAMKHAREGQRP